MKKKKKLKRLVSVGVFTLITSLLWVSLESYRELVKKEEIKKVDQLLIPLDPNLETDILDQIEARREYQPDQVENFWRVRPTLAETAESVSPSPTATAGAEVVSLTDDSLGE